MNVLIDVPSAPSAETARAVCALLGIKPPLPRKLKKHNPAAVASTLRSMMVVCYDVAMAEAEADRAVTQGALYHAVAGIWSPRYRDVLSATPATSYAQMTKETLEQTNRELKAQGISGVVLKQAWGMVCRGIPGMYQPHVTDRRRSRLVHIANGKLSRDAAAYDDPAGWGLAMVMGYLDGQDIGLDKKQDKKLRAQFVKARAKGMPLEFKWRVGKTGARLQTLPVRPWSPGEPCPYVPSTPGQVFDGELRDKFEELVSLGPGYAEYRKTLLAHLEKQGRILLAEEAEDGAWEEEDDSSRGKVAEEWAWDKPVQGARSSQVIRLLEGARVSLDLDAVWRDYPDPALDDHSECYEARQKCVPSGPAACDDPELAPATRRKIKRAARQFLTARRHQEVLAATEGRGEVVISPRYHRTVTCRYQPDSFWPSEITKEARKRWLRIDGQATKWLDMSSCGPQFADLLTDNQDRLSRLTPERGYKQVAQEFAFSEGLLNEGYEGAGDPRIKELASVAVVQQFYGASPESTQRHTSRDPDRFGPGFTGPQAIETLTEHVLSPDWLRACRDAAAAAYQRDPYEGVIVVDPLDGAELRWNPPLREYKAWPGLKEDRHRFGEVQVYRYGLVGPRCPAGKYTGDWLVDPKQLARAVSPRIMQTLDGFLCALVIEGLAALGVTNFVAVNDGWGVAADNYAALESVLDSIEVRSAWFLGLEHVYSFLERYLPNHPDVSKWRAAWQARVDQADWPKKFVYKPE